MLCVKQEESPYITGIRVVPRICFVPFCRDGAFFVQRELLTESPIHLADHKNKGEKDHGYERKASGTGRECQNSD